MKGSRDLHLGVATVTALLVVLALTVAVLSPGTSARASGSMAVDGPMAMAHGHDAKTPPPVHTEQPRNTERPESTAPPESDERSKKTERPESTEPPERTESPERTNPPKNTEQPERTERPEGTERPEATHAARPTPDTAPEPTDTATDRKVSICHATGSPSNPYVQITVDESALDAHRAHGDIIPAPPGGCPGAGTAVPGATVTPHTPDVPGSRSYTFPQTGKTVKGLFLDYWQTHGGVMQQGYPIAPSGPQPSSVNWGGPLPGSVNWGRPNPGSVNWGGSQGVSPTPGTMNTANNVTNNVYTMQYFERAVFEYHPENKPPYDVLLSQLGTSRYKFKYPNGAPNQSADTKNGQYFPETKRWVGDKFWQYWQQHGGLMQQGFPISNEFTEKSEVNGQTYKVQYFERAVFEYHPENKPPYDVLLTPLGAMQYKARFGNSGK